MQVFDDEGKIELQEGWIEYGLGRSNPPHPPNPYSIQPCASERILFFSETAMALSFQACVFGFQQERAFLSHLTDS
jgi:hypothetical protein